VVDTLSSIDGTPVERQVFPESAEALAETMKEACEAGRTMAAIGGGRHLHLGNPPGSVNLGIHLSRLRGIVEYEPGNLTVSVRAGTTLADLQNALRAANQFLPLDPAGGEAATLGGLLAANASGPLRLRYGTLRDLLIGIRMVHADGSRTRAGGKLVKNVAGYDMCKLYTGSLGTLGFCTELTLKVQPASGESATLALGFPSLPAALEATQAILRSELLPDAVEAINATAYAALAAPPAAGSWILLVRFGEARTALHRQLDRTRDLAAASGASILQVSGDGATQELWRRLADQRAGNGSASGLLLKCAALYQSAAATGRLLEQAGERLQAQASLYCHAGIHVYHACYRWTGPECAPGAIQDAIRELRRHCRAAGGHLVVERARPEVKQGLDVWGYEAPALDLMRRIKMQFDPKGLLNPGRFVGGI